MLKVRIDGKPVMFETTIFPDGTSQVWKMEPPDREGTKDIEIIWLWENEAEVFQLAQLVRLLRHNCPFSLRYLTVPYLPYGRQDKEVGNDATFALRCFGQFINSLHFYAVRTFDAHSDARCIDHLTSVDPAEFHVDAIRKFRTDTVFYPDAGAQKRYGTPGTYGEKKRDPLTGIIESYAIFAPTDQIEDKRVLIIDDICDYGTTFIMAAKALYALGASRVGLCVSHGLFSKGVEPLWNASLTDIYTTNSLLRNEGAFNVYE